MEGHVKKDSHLVFAGESEDERSSCATDVVELQKKRLFENAHARTRFIGGRGLCFREVKGVELVTFLA